MIGVDADESMTRFARRQHPTISFVRGVLPHLPFAAESFDAVVANFVVNHTPDPRASLRELGRVSKPGGSVGVTVWPGEVSPMNQLWNNVMSAASVQPPQGKTLPADKGFERTEAGLAGIVTEAGLDVVAVRTLRWSFCIDRDDLWLAVEGGIATIGHIYRAQDEVARGAMRAAYERLTDEFQPDGKLRLPSSALMAVALRPSHQSLR